jgi:hypothetical protein
VKEDEIGRACNMNGEKKNAYRVLLVKKTAERKEPLG